MKSRALQQLNQHSCDGWQPSSDTAQSSCSCTQTAQHCHISCLSVVDGGLSTTSNPRASLMPTEQVTAQTEQHSTVQGQLFARVCPVRTAPKSGCCQQSTAAGITKPEAKCVDDSWSCESDESADDTNTTSRKSYLHHSQIGLE